MRSPSILTVVVKVDPDKIVELEGYLRDSVNPTPDGATKAFGFENYPKPSFHQLFHAARRRRTARPTGDGGDI